MVAGIGLPASNGWESVLRAVNARGPHDGPEVRRICTEAGVRISVQEERADPERQDNFHPDMLNLRTH